MAIDEVTHPIPATLSAPAPDRITETMTENTNTWTELHQLITRYILSVKPQWETDILDALDEIIAEHYFKETPPPYKEELTQLLTEYADNKGAELAEVLDVVIDLMPDLLDDITERWDAKMEAKSKRRKR